MRTQSVVGSSSFITSVPLFAPPNEPVPSSEPTHEFFTSRAFLDLCADPRDHHNILQASRRIADMDTRNRALVEGQLVNAQCSMLVREKIAKMISPY